MLRGVISETLAGYNLQDHSWRIPHGLNHCGKLKDHVVQAICHEKSMENRAKKWNSTINPQIAYPLRTVLLYKLTLYESLEYCAQRRTPVDFKGLRPSGN